jgi:DNA anti-recombination protein RmuC
MEFHETKMGAKFFNADLPALIMAIEKLADNMVQELPGPVIGRFAEISEQEQQDLDSLSDRFNEFFDQMVENFSLKEVYTTKNELQSVKNLVRHGWLAGKK